MLFLGPLPIKSNIKSKLKENNFYYLKAYHDKLIIIVNQFFCKLETPSRPGKQNSQIEYAYLPLSIYSLSYQLQNLTVPKTFAEVEVIKMLKSKSQYVGYDPNSDPDGENGVEFPAYTIKPSSLMSHTKNDSRNVFKMLTGHGYVSQSVRGKYKVCKYFNKSNSTQLVEYGWANEVSLKERATQVFYKYFSYYHIDDIHVFVTVYSYALTQLVPYQYLNNHYFLEQLEVRNEIKAYRNYVNFAQEWAEMVYCDYYRIWLDDTEQKVQCLGGFHRFSSFMKISLYKILFDLLNFRVPSDVSFRTIDKEELHDRISSINDMEYICHAKILYKYRKQAGADYQDFAEQVLCIRLVSPFQSPYIQGPLIKNWYILISSDKHEKVFHELFSKYEMTKERANKLVFIKNFLVRVVAEPDIQVVYDNRDSVELLLFHELRTDMK